MAQPLPVSAIYLLPVYTDRATYLVEEGKQAPPFDATRAIQLTDSPGPQPVPVFDKTAAPGYVGEMVIAAAINLPGPYNYPPLVVPETSATWVYMGSTVLMVNAHEICLEADAQALAAVLRAEVFPAQNVVIGDPSAGQPYNWGAETRRPWTLLVAGEPQTWPCEPLLEAMAVNGVGAPGSWSKPLPTGGWEPVWTPAQQVTAAPANSKTLPIPIVMISPGWQIALIGQGPFSSGTFVYQPIPPARPSIAQQIATLQAEELQIAQQIAALQAQQAA
jgi:hypothetical protein